MARGTQQTIPSPLHLINSSDHTFSSSGAAFNPAVTFSLWLVGNLTARRAIATTIAQLLGGIAAAGAAKGLTIGTFGVTNTLSDGVSIGKNVSRSRHWQPSPNSLASS